MSESIDKEFTIETEDAELPFNDFVELVENGEQATLSVDASGLVVMKYHGVKLSSKFRSKVSD